MGINESRIYHIYIFDRQAIQLLCSIFSLLYYTVWLWPWCRRSNDSWYGQLQFNDRLFGMGKHVSLTLYSIYLVKVTSMYLTWYSFLIHIWMCVTMGVLSQSNVYVFDMIFFFNSYMTLRAIGTGHTSNGLLIPRYIMYYVALSTRERRAWVYTQGNKEKRESRKKTDCIHIRLSMCIICVSYSREHTAFGRFLIHTRVFCPIYRSL